MSSTSPAALSRSGTLSKVNFPLIVLWLASVVIGALGYLMMTSSNSDQAAIYASGTADYEKLFAAQSGTTLGGLLIAVGALGVLLALAAQAIRRRGVALPLIATVHDLELEDEVDDDVDDELMETRAAAPTADATQTAAPESETAAAEPEIVR